jgi:hypothetical protein
LSFIQIAVCRSFPFSFLSSLLFFSFIFVSEMIASKLVNHRRGCFVLLSVVAERHGIRAYKHTVVVIRMMHLRHLAMVVRRLLSSVVIVRSSEVLKKVFV